MKNFAFLSTLSFFFLLIVFSSCKNELDSKFLEQIDTPLKSFADYQPNAEKIGTGINALLLTMSGEPAALNNFILVDGIRQSTKLLHEQYVAAFQDYTTTLAELQNLKKDYSAGKKTKEESLEALKALEPKLREVKNRMDQLAQGLQRNEAGYNEVAQKFKEDPTAFGQRAGTGTPGAAGNSGERKMLETTPDGRGFVRPKQ